MHRKLVPEAEDASAEVEASGVADVSFVPFEGVLGDGRQVLWVGLGLVVADFDSFGDEV